MAKKNDAHIRLHELGSHRVQKIPRHHQAPIVVARVNVSLRFRERDIDRKRMKGLVVLVTGQRLFAIGLIDQDRFLPGSAVGRMDSAPKRLSVSRLPSSSVEIVDR